MIENFTNLPSVKTEMSVREMHKCRDTDKNQKPRIVSLSLLFEWIITKLITIWEIMDIMFFFKIVGKGISREDLLMTKEN